MTVKKNIMLIMCDQLRADFLSCYGASFIQTPNIDALCSHGARYTRAISPSPLCVPARASLLTGLNALSTGVLSNNEWLRPDMEQCGVKTWPSLLAEHGYHTESIGKMHFTPWDTDHGFQHRVISEDKRHIHVKDDYYDYLQRHGLRKLHGNEHEGYFEHKGAVISKTPPEHQVDRWVGAQTRAFLEASSRDKPFAVMVGFPGPHCPYDPSLELAGLFDPATMPDSIPETEESRTLREYFIQKNLAPWNQVDYTDFQEHHKKKIRAHYAALVHQIDQEVGAIVDTLKSQGLYENTVILFTSDHGDFIGDFGFVGKHFFFEPSISIPLIVHHPDIEASSVNGSIVSLTDVNETILQIAGVSRSGPAQSVMLPGLPFGEKSVVPRATVFGATDVGVMIMNEDWKLSRYYNGMVSLHSISRDPGEQNNLAYKADTLEIQQALDQQLTAELMASVLWGHQEKTIVRDATYFNRGWARKYPVNG
ncbi:sulfatase-like hydrolase/transferase [Paenibacillus sp. IB182496]|uniref:Sulfatase-like hydrolase/transferase n=1 Tax=Paenibacillus sabuli TaxID=2772509 RepID=A0A927BR59_9BACL|nr:sulfatase-like hydrolase/transferase [Paenibacillus sabuli]MBD2844029.1 sulfatase-like hydrolase/transferase [Paenibacillus sabuli]